MPDACSSCLAFVIGSPAAPPRPAARQRSALVADSGPLDAVVKRTFTAYGFRLQSGACCRDGPGLRDVRAPGTRWRNAILITPRRHVSGHAAGKYSPTTACRAGGTG